MCIDVLCFSLSSIHSPQKWEQPTIHTRTNAGKSTLYNATLNPATDAEGARCASFPFTTITPNIGRGYFACPCPCVQMGVAGQCGAGFGHVSADFLHLPPTYSNPTGKTEHAASDRSFLNSPEVHKALRWRRVPVVMKDVAGLVPGAFAGRGKGNAFLNDLVDADVLMHVVDASGTTDQEGNLVTGAGGGGADDAKHMSDPLTEIMWVREEIHRWIFDNLKAKWASLVRRPEKLASMFSGYHATPQASEKTLAVLGLTPVTMDKIRAWDELDLHLLVAVFIRMRFPIVYALNKADLGSSAERIQRVLTERPWEPCVAVSAQSETWLCKQRRAGFVSYQDGSATVVLKEAGASAPGVKERLEEIKRDVLDRYGGTGVLAAVTAAAALRTPALAFPVFDLHSCESLRPLTFVKDGTIASSAEMLEGGGAGLASMSISFVDSASPAVLRDCVVMHPGSQVEHLFAVLKKPPVTFLEGDFVRCEGIQLDPRNGEPVAQETLKRPWKKEEQIGWAVLHVMTNRRAQWQKIAAGRKAID